jgi:hypothetical protein
MAIRQDGILGELEAELESETELESEFEAESGLGEMESELELETETETELESEFETEHEQEQFFSFKRLARGIAGLARRAAPIVSRIARTAMPLVAKAVGGAFPLAGIAGQLAGSLLSEGETEFESELESESLLETESELEHEHEHEHEHEIAAQHMAAAAAEAALEHEAEAMVGAASVTMLSERDRAALGRLLPHMVRGTAVLTRILRRRRITRPYVRVVPTIMKRTVQTLARSGRPITRRMAARAMALQTGRVLSSPRTCASVIYRTVRTSRRPVVAARARGVRG